MLSSTKEAVLWEWKASKQGAGEKGLPHEQEHLGSTWPETGYAAGEL